VIKHLHHSQIDSVKWNDCLAKVEDAHFYALYEYLTSICDWNALIIDDGMEYQLIVPLPFKSKFGLKYLYQPFFCQQLGVYALQSMSPEISKAIKNQIKKNYFFGSMNWYNSQGFEQGFKLEKKVNYVLNLDLSLEELKQNFNSNRRRLLNKLEKTVDLSSTSDGLELEAVIENYKIELGSRFPEILPNHYCDLKVAFASIQNKVDILVVRANEDGAVISESLFVIYKKKIVYLLGYNLNAYSKKSGLTICFGFVMEKFNNQGYMLDFEGGSIDGIGRFYESLGGIKKEYFQLKFNYYIPTLIKRIR
jgi:hypothetical protein